MSPFDDQRGDASRKPVSSRGGGISKMAIGAAIMLGTLVAVAAVMFFWRKTVDDPYRTLEPFSADKYFENPQSLTGNRFRATLRVEGDLGWKEGVGKLMVFSVEGDSRFVPVLVAGGKLNISFSKGQTYTANIQVQEGGLIHATDFKKN